MAYPSVTWKGEIIAGDAAASLSNGCGRSWNGAIERRHRLPSLEANIFFVPFRMLLKKCCTHVRCDSSFRFLIDVTFRFPCGGACAPQKSIKSFLRAAYDELYKHYFQQILTVAAQEEHRKTNY
jgi:hypothetical protein